MLTLATTLGVAAMAQDVGALSGLTRPENALALPSVGRILGVLMLMIALAVGALYAIRRWKPQLDSRLATGRSIKVIERTLVGGVRVYLLQVDDQRVLLSEHRGRTSMISLPSASHSSNSQTLP